MPDPQGDPAAGGKRTGSTTELPRRRFLQTSAAAVTAAGFGFGGGSAAAQMGSVPGYAEYIPANADDLILENGAVELVSTDLQAFFEIITLESEQEEEEQETDSETTQFQFEPQVLGIFSVVTPLSLYDQLGLGSAVPGAATAGLQSPPEEIPDLRTDRVTTASTSSIGTGLTITSGSYDEAEIASAIEESSLSESDTSGIFVGSDPRFGGSQTDVQLALGWSSEYIISASSVSLVKAAMEARNGSRPTLYSQNADLEQQLAAIAPGDFTSTAYSVDGALEINRGNTNFIDYSPIAELSLQGYTQSNSWDLENGVVTAISVLNHTSASAAASSDVSGVGADADERSVSRDGRYVTINSTIRGEFQQTDDSTDDSTDSTDDGTGDSTDDGTGDSTDDSTSDSTDDSTDSTDDSTGDSTDSTDDSTDSESSDGSDGSDDGSDGSSSDGSDGGDGSDGESSSNESESSDGSGPGFGVFSAVTGLGGAGYLLKQRLDTERPDTD